jgi:transposase
MPEYTDAFKAKMVQRLLGPRAVSAVALSREIGVPQSTLSAWLRKARRPMERQERSASVPERRDARDKLRIVTTAEGMPDDEVGAFLRREGVHQTELEQWRAAMLEALGESTGRPSTPESKRVKQLEREVKRKDRALAEAAALLVLQKKVRALWGDEDDDTDEGSGK